MLCRNHSHFTQALHRDLSSHAKARCKAPARAQERHQQPAWLSPTALPHASLLWLWLVPTRMLLATVLAALHRYHPDRPLALTHIGYSVGSGR